MLIKMVLAGKSEAKVDAGDLLLKLSVSIMMPLLVSAARGWPAAWAACCAARWCLPVPDGEGRPWAARPARSRGRAGCEALLALLAAAAGCCC
jgi:hypothetical protein